MGTMDERTALGYRSPWFWLFVLGALAIAGTVVILMMSRSRLHAIEANFSSSQMVRLQRVVQRIDDYFACANQLTLSSSSFAAQTVGDERNVRWFVTRLYLSRRDQNVYGLGVFYAPNVWPRARLA